MMKQPFTKFGVTTLFSLLCSAFLHAQVVTDERMFSFEEPQIPDCITATHSRLSVSDLHYKDGKHSLEWTFEPGGILELKKDLKFEKKFFQAEDGIRDHCVTGVQTCALRSIISIITKIIIS